MIVFASSITEPDTYRRCAQRGIQMAAEPDSQVIANSAAGSLFRSYNLILDTVARRDDVEGLVLLHQDAEIADLDFCAKLRKALSDPDVAVVGCVGAIGVRSIAWWEGSVTWASFVHRYSELGGGDLPAFAFNGAEMPAYARLGEVETVDGFVLALSPWAVRNIRFDESLGLLHGYDFDYCLQVREAGRKVVTADFKVIHHHSLELIGSPETWVQAHMRVAEKWEDRMPDVGVVPGTWKERARRAEAEAAAAHARAVSIQLQADARQKEIDESTSWRLTKPLRQLNTLRRRLRRR
jgi:hypothetical protein